VIVNTFSKWRFDAIANVGGSSGADVSPASSRRFKSPIRAVISCSGTFGLKKLVPPKRSSLNRIEIPHVNLLTRIFGVERQSI
jgi:hypothetical protein